MRIEGRFQFDGAARQSVWNFLTDATQIAQCLPGCESLKESADGAYAMQMKFGIGAISGTFSGSIRLHGLDAPHSYQMSVSGAGAPGFINGEGSIMLAETGDGTLLEYSGNVTAGGAIASVGQRMIGGAARMVIDQFFKCVAAKL